MTDKLTDKRWAYVGTYTRREPHVLGRSEGIYVLRFDPSSGELSLADIVTGIENPSYLALHPAGTALYAISEISDFEGRASGAAAAYSIDPETGKIAPLNRQSTKGTGPAYVTVSPLGTHVLVANYGGGSVSVLPIRADLSLGGASAFVQHEGSSANPQRQEGPHAHSVVVDAAGRYAMAADLGMDKIMIYRFDAPEGALAANPDQPWARAKSGSGPRHIAFHPSQRFAYVINELDSTVTAYRFEADRGALTEIQTVSTLPSDFTGKSYAADIHVHPTGQWVYGSNRGHDSIAMFSVDSESGELDPIGIVASGGKVPRGFALDASGIYALVANQDSDNVVVFEIDLGSGQMTQTDIVLEVPTPVCIKLGS